MARYLLKKSNRSRLPSPLQITPMIDVIFLLLIYFLLSTSYTPPEAELAPALQAEQIEGGRSADLQPQIVRVDLFGGEPGFRLAEQVFRDAETLRGVLADLPKEGGVFIEGADAVSVRWAAAAIQAGRDAGFEKVTYVPSR
ncbi:MAG: biopolymer transporter ExbD [bacterium]|nr:biopolymer transporter ExbD [bacterium]